MKIPFNHSKKLMIPFSYLILGIIRILQVVSNLFSDSNEHFFTAYQISIGKIPYVDFFQHHLLVNNFIESVFFLISTNPLFIISVFAILSIITMFSLTWVVYELAKRYKLKNPHFASLFFLVSFAGTHKLFLRAEYFIMVFMLLFFYFRNPFFKAFFLVLAGSSQPMFFLPSATIGVIWVYQTYKNKKKILQLVLGGLSSVILLIYLHWKIPFSTLYYYIITFNFKTLPTFFTGVLGWIHFLFFALLPISIGLYYSFKLTKKKKKYALLIFSFMLIYMLEHLFFNMKYGFLFRKRVYEFLPLIAISSIFFASLNSKISRFLLLSTLLATSITIVPSFDLTSIKYIYVSNKLDSCISEDAEIGYNLFTEKTHRPIYIFRPTPEYRWFGWSTDETYWGTPYEPPLFKNQIDVCGIMLSKNDIVCDDEEINKIEEYCVEKLTFPPDIVKNTLVFTANKLCGKTLPETNRLCRYY